MTPYLYAGAVLIPILLCLRLTERDRRYIVAHASTTKLLSLLLSDVLFTVIAFSGWPLFAVTTIFSPREDTVAQWSKRAMAILLVAWCIMMIGSIREGG